MRRTLGSFLLLALSSSCGDRLADGGGGAVPVHEELVAARPEALARLSTTGDPCDFTKAAAFGYDQVLACYRSVPWCPDPSNPATCDRDVQVAHARQAIESFSDLREIYDARYHWRRQLDAIERARFDGDFDQFIAFGEVFANFRSDHWFYSGPTCFEQTIFELIPINFGSALTKAREGRDREQIIYLRDAQPVGGGAFDLSGYNDFYRETTGIDVSTFVGQRVLRINGEDPLDFFRRWGRRSLRQDDNDGINLMSILDEAYFTLRSGSFNPFPESASISLVLEDTAGKRTRVELPWIFIPFAAIGFPGPVPASSAEFRALCFQPSASATASATTATSAGNGVRALDAHRALALREPTAHLKRLAERRVWATAMTSNLQRSGHRHEPSEFFEVPPEQLNQDITEIFPPSDGARTVAYTDDTVAIQTRIDFVQDWDAEFDQGARYACEHARRLIVDLRGNLGGYVSRLQRVAHYLNPTAPAFSSASLSFRQDARSSALNELRQLSEQLQPLGFPPCYAGYEAQCFLGIPSGQAVMNPLWYQDETLERRGHALQHLTPLVTYESIVPVDTYAIPCPGKFTGKNLVVLLNGLNSSAAFFLPELVRPFGTLVVEGGYLGEPMTTGRARGGPTAYSDWYTADLDFLTGVLGTTPQFRLPELPRPVTFRLEYNAFYRPDLRTLYADHPPVGEIQLPFWSNTRDTDGAAYRAAISAVERKAIVDPSCGAPDRARSCHHYRSCARGALDQALGADLLSATAAERTLQDAVALCRAD